MLINIEQKLMLKQDTLKHSEKVICLLATEKKVCMEMVAPWMDKEVLMGAQETV